MVFTVLRFLRLLRIWGVGQRGVVPNADPLSSDPIAIAAHAADPHHQGGDDGSNPKKLKNLKKTRKTKNPENLKTSKKTKNETPPPTPPQQM